MKYVVIDEYNFERIAGLISYHNQHKSENAKKFLDEDLKVVSNILDAFSEVKAEQQFISPSIIHDAIEAGRKVEY